MQNESETSMSEQPNIIDTTALTEYVKDIRQRANQLLSTQGAAVKPEMHEQLYDMGDEIFSMTCLLAYAITAHKMLVETSEQLAHKAYAYEEVFNLERPGGTCKFAVKGAVAREKFGEPTQLSDCGSIPF